MGAEQTGALDVLREVWRSSGQSAADLDNENETGKTCKRMADAGVGFDDFAAGESDLQAAWRARLAREGKLAPGAATIRDLVMGPGEQN